MKQSAHLHVLLRLRMSAATVTALPALSIMATGDLKMGLEQGKSSENRDLPYNHTENETYTQ
jgi:hypothetical protein